MFVFSCVFCVCGSGGGTNMTSMYTTCGRFARLCVYVHQELLQVSAALKTVTEKGLSYLKRHSQNKNSFTGHREMSKYSFV